MGQPRHLEINGHCQSKILAALHQRSELRQVAACRCRCPFSDHVGQTLLRPSGVKALPRTDPSDSFTPIPFAIVVTFS